MKEIVKNAIALTTALVKIASESSDPMGSYRFGPEFGVAEYLQKLCTDRGIYWRLQEALLDRFNFIAFFPQENAPKLLIVAHMDTVSAKGMEEPFSANITDGKLYGRGACDDKGPLATALATLMGLRDKGVMRYDVTFVGTVDEECSMAGAAQFAKECGDYDLCIAIEPTGLRLINAHKGVYRGQVICKGKATHSSTPKLGDNAIIKMHEVITDLLQYGEELEAHNDPLLGDASMAITKISGGSVINIIPDSCEISFDIRLLPEHEPKEIQAVLKKIIGDRGKLRKIFATNAIHPGPVNNHIKQFTEAIRSGGEDPRPTTAAYATDCSKLIKKGPCIVWGPGHIEQAHKSIEYIEISQIEKGCRILADFLMDG